jgi:polar amino acid transport system substrate-binding protein
MKKACIVLCVLLACLAPVFAGGEKEKTDGFVFAADATWPPLEFVDNGVLTGFEVELMPMIGEKIGVKMTVKNIPWDTIFAGLANGAYDGVASGVTVTDERKLTMDFSTPILSAGQVVIVRTGDAEKFKGIQDLDGRKIGVQIGTTGDFALDDYNVVKRAYDDIGLAIEDMMNGNLDAAVCDSLIASDFVLANDNYKGKITVVGEPVTQEDIAIAVKKGDTKLLNLINEGLAKMEADGSLAALKAKWNIL